MWTQFPRPICILYIMKRHLRCEHLLMWSQFPRPICILYIMKRLLRCERFSPGVHISKDSLCMKLGSIFICVWYDFQVIRGAGHHVYADRWEEFNSSVAKLCNVVDRESSKKKEKQVQEEEEENKETIMSAVNPGAIIIESAIWRGKISSIIVLPKGCMIIWLYITMCVIRF